MSAGRRPLLARWSAVFLCVVGALSQSRLSAAEADAPIELPPLIVSDRSNQRPWRFAETSELQVLARCDEAITYDFIERHHRLLELMRFILPPDLQYQPAMRTTLVLVESDAAGSLSEQLVKEFGATGDARDPSRPSATGSAAAPRSVRMLPNLELQDVDGFVVFAIADRRTFNSGRLAFTQGHLRLLLERRVPPLPRWFIEGCLRVLGEMDFGDESIRLAPFTWVSDALTQRLQDDADAARDLMPMRDFFALTPSKNTPPDVASRWMSQAELLVRWSLTAPERKAALWRYIAAVADGEDREGQLRACFGLGFADLRDRLSDYLPVAIRESASFEPPRLSRPPRIELRNATAAEVGRLKGEWERLEYTSVRLRYPQFAPKYLELARATINTARINAPADPGLLSTAGLLECDVGQRDAARPLLEAAAAGAKARPRVYCELAMFRLADALKDLDESEFRISPGRAAIVLEMLQKAQEQQPPLAAVYALRAEVWARSGVRLSPADRDLLSLGVRLFPNEPRVLYFSALLCAEQVSIDAAMRLVDRGLAITEGQPMNQRFRVVRTALEQAKQKARQPEQPTQR